jgi:two-component system CheB/CheR fusion protein
MNTVTSPLRVLVVDDSEDTAESLRILASFWGHDVRVACDGLEALHQAEDFRPQVVLLDIGMPRMSGYKVAQALRHAPGLEEVLLIATTGYGSSADRQQTAEAGFDLHLLKPYSPEDLEHLLAEAACGRRPDRVVAAFRAEACSEKKGGAW